MNNLNDSELVESYKFWDIVALWGRERLEHDVIIALDVRGRTGEIEDK